MSRVLAKKKGHWYRHQEVIKEPAYAEACRARMEQSMDSWKGKSVLIAGGAGMIGSHVARALLKRGAEVCVADNLSSGIPRNIEDISDSVQLEVADLRDADNCLRLTQGRDVVFQFAANMGGIAWITEIGADIMRDSALININMLPSSHIPRISRS